MGRVEIFRSVLQSDTAIFYDDGTYEVIAKNGIRSAAQWKIEQGDFYCKGDKDQEWWLVDKYHYPAFIVEMLPQLKSAILEKAMFDE